MATKGKAAKSSTGASMSKYDVEVESRLQALEKVAHPVPTGATQQKVDDRLAALEASVAAIQVLVYGNGSSNEGTRLDNLIAKLTTIPAIASYCDRDEEGNRSLGV
tara:strand:- start:136 stop:453 length:318 start_codon:yes stop_codon:yes gene_type:complete